MAGCCRALPGDWCYFPGEPCPEPLQADSVGWSGVPGTETDTSGTRFSQVEKVVGGVVIRGRVINNPGPLRTFNIGPSATSGSPSTSVGVIEGPNQTVDMEFTISVPQEQIVMKVEDIDSAAGTGQERVILARPGMTNPGREADRVVRYLPEVGGNVSLGTVQWQPNPGNYRVVGADENALELTWRNQPWGDGTNGAPPVRVSYDVSANTGRGSYFDFGGPIWPEPCDRAPRRASGIICCAEDCTNPEVVSGVETMHQPDEGGGTRQVRYRNYGGSGVDVTVTMTGGVGNLAGTASDTTGQPSLGIGMGNRNLAVAFSRPVRLRSMEISDLDLGDERYYASSPPVTGVSGTLAWPSGQCPGPATSPCVRARANNTRGTIFYGGVETSSLTFSVSAANSLGAFISGLTFDYDRCVQPEWVDTATGEALTPEQLSTLTRCDRSS